MAALRRRRTELVDASLKSETDPSATSDDEDSENLDDRINTGWKLYEQIFSFLEIENLLLARQVCKRWNHIICSDSLLFSKIRVKVQNGTQPPTRSSTSLNFSPAPSSPNFANGFNCPNFHFESCDFRCVSIHDFLLSRGHFLQHLKLTNCLLTLPTLQGIMMGCINIEYFELNGVHRALASCERIFPKPYQFRCFPRLRTLVLKSVEPEISVSIENRSPLSPSCEYEVNLLPGFLHDLIEHSEYLERVHLLNWSAKTSSYFMNIINQRARYKQFKEFHSSQMRPVITSVDLIPFCVRTAHANLTILTLSPSSPLQHHEFGDTMLRGILRNYRLSLEQLNITNCPVTSAIFRAPMPKLKTLIAIGTNISSIALFFTLTPNLKTALFRKPGETPMQTIESCLNQYNLSTQQLPSMAIERYIANRLGYFRGHYLLTPKTPSKIRSQSEINYGRGRRKSVIKEFYACSTFDFANLVLFGMAFILLFIFGLSTIFKSYSLPIFISFVVLIFLWEIYEIWKK